MQEAEAADEDAGDTRGEVGAKTRQEGRFVWGSVKCPHRGAG